MNNMEDTWVFIRDNCRNDKICYRTFFKLGIKKEDRESYFQKNGRYLESFELWEEYKVIKSDKESGEILQEWIFKADECRIFQDLFCELEHTELQGRRIIDEFQKGMPWGQW